MSMMDAYCKEAVTITLKGNVGADGRMPYGAGDTSTTARVEHRTGIVRTADRGDLAYTLIMYFRPTETIRLLDRITKGSANYTVINIYKPAGLDGNIKYIKVWLA